MLFLGNPQAPEMAVVVEVQLDPDDHKPWRWPLYVTTLADRHRCPVHLVVVAMRPDVAAWASRLPQVSPSVVLRPVVLGPDVMPRPDALIAGTPPAALLLLSLGMHARDRMDARLVDRLLDVEPTGIDDFGGLRDYNRLMAALLAKVAPELKEDGMNIDLGEVGTVFDQLWDRAEARGRAEGRAEGLEKALEENRTLFQTLAASRGWVLSAAQLAQLHATQDTLLLHRWCARVVSASSVDEALRS